MAPVEEVEEEQGEEAEAEVPQKNEDGWEEMMEGKIKKRTVKEGKGDPPEFERDVVCSFEVRSQDSQVLQRRDRFRYRIGESEAIPALEMGLRHMQKGEEAEIAALSRFLWGPEGCPAVGSNEKDVPPDADVLLYVTLHEILPPQPADRSRQQWTDRVQELEWRKTNGNDHFKRKKLAVAARCYEKGMEVFPEVPIIAPSSLGRSADAAAAAATKMLADVASNLSAVYLEQEKVRDALDHAKIAVDLCPKHDKALYRAAKAAMQLGDFKECEEHLAKLQPLQPEDPGVKRLAADLEKAKSKHASKAKKLGAALLEAAGDRKEYEVKPKAEGEDDDEGEAPFSFKELLPTRNMVLLVCALIALTALAIFLAPGPWKAYAIIGGLLGSILTVSVVSAVTSPDEPAETKKETKKRK